jgi:hypothetical protein
MQFQRKNLVESTDNSDESDHLNLMRDLDHDNKMVKVFALGSVKRKLQMFTEQD